MRFFYPAVLALLYLCLGFPSGARAAAPDFSGNDLLKMCTSTYDTDYGYCAGYVSGISNVLLTQGVEGYRACGHAPVRSQQAIDIFRAYAEVFPEMMQGAATTAVAAAFARAFPCK